MNQRKWGTILSYAQIIISNTISLIYTPYMLRMMGTSEYGIYGTAASFVSYLSILNFGVSGAYIRFNAQCRAAGDREGEKRLNGMFLTVFAILSVLVVVVGMGLVFFAEALVKQTFTSQELFRLRILLVILIVNMVISFLFNVVVMALMAYEQFIIIRASLLFFSILTPVTNVIALKMGGRSVAITAIALVTSIVSYAVYYLYARRAIAMEFLFSGFEWTKFREIFVFSSFLFLNTITDQITYSTDNIVLSALKGTTATAIYTVGSSFKMYFGNFSVAISSVFAPKINDMIARGEDMSVLDELFVRVGRLQFYVVSLILMGFSLIGYDFVILWAGEDYKESFTIAWLLMVSVFVPSIQNLGLEIQKAKNMHKARSVVYFLVALVNVIMTIPMSKLWGGIGAAAATMICMFFGTVVFMNIYYYCRVKVDVVLFWKSIASILPGLIPPLIVGILVRILVDIRSWGGFLIAVLVITGVYCLSVWCFSMNDYEKNLLRGPIRSIGSKFRK